MTRIEIKGSVQLRFPESSTILVIPASERSESNVATTSQMREEPAVEAGSILKVIQDFKTFGPEDIDTKGNLSRLTQDFRRVRGHGVPIGRVFKQLDTVFAETKINQEGAKIGTLPAAMFDLKKSLTELAEDIWTEPTPTAV